MRKQYSAMGVSHTAHVGVLAATTTPLADPSTLTLFVRGVGGWSLTKNTCSSIPPAFSEAWMRLVCAAPVRKVEAINMLTISLFISTEGVAASRNAEAVINAFPLSVAGTFLSVSGGITRRQARSVC
jgi:hypothetical protein